MKLLVTSKERFVGLKKNVSLDVEEFTGTLLHSDIEIVRFKDLDKELKTGFCVIYIPCPDFTTYFVKERSK